MNYPTLLKTYPRYLGFGFLHMFTASIGQTFIIALFIPYIRETYGKSAAFMGSWYGIITMVSAGVFLITGQFIDRINLRAFSMFAGGMVLAGCLLLGLSPYLVPALLGLFCIRHGGQALLTHTAITALSRYFTMARGKALAIAGLGMSAGSACLPFLLALVLASMHWKQVYLILAAIVLFGFAPLSLLLVNKHDDIQHPLASQEESEAKELAAELGWGRLQVVRHPYFWFLLPLLLMPPMLGTGFFFFQADIAASKGWSRALFASSFFAYGISAASASFISGPLVDRWGARRMLPWTLLPMIAGTSVLLLSKSIVGGFVFMMLLGGTFGLVGNVRNAMWAEVYGRLHLGSIKSFAGTIFVFSTAVAPALGGWLLDNGVTVTQLLQGCVILCLVATIIALFAKPPQT